MIKFLRFVLALSACIINLCVLSSCVFFVFFLVQFLRLFLPKCICQNLMTHYDRICHGLIQLHSKNLRRILKNICKVNLNRYFCSALSRDHSFVMLINHRSHVDILVILAVFYDQVPDVKFFLKKSLLWVPFLGQFCYLMNYIFVKKISKNAARKDPSMIKKQRDLISQKCQSLVKKPVTLAVFAEGTRFISEKKKQERQLFVNLLAPQTAGVALALEASSKYVSDLLDVTLVYDVGFVSVWLLLSGQVNDIEVHVQRFDVAKANLLGDYLNDRNYRKYFSNWVRALWQKKDVL